LVVLYNMSVAGVRVVEFGTYGGDKLGENMMLIIRFLPITKAFLLFGPPTSVQNVIKIIININVRAHFVIGGKLFAAATRDVCSCTSLSVFVYRVRALSRAKAI